MKVGMTPVLKLKVSLPRFTVAREGDEDDANFFARVEKEARVLVGSYTRPEHEAYAVLLNNGRLNRVLELTGVSYGPHSAPASVEVLKKQKADSVWKTVSKGPKAHEKKRVEHVKTSTTPVKISVKRPSDANPTSPKSVKLSKKTIPHMIASAVAAHDTLLAYGSKVVAGVSDLVTVEGHPLSKTIGGSSGSKIAAPVKKHRVPPTGPMARASSEESQNSSPRGTMTQTLAPKILLRSEPCDQSPPASIHRPNPPVVLQTTTPFGAGGGSTCFCGLCSCVCLCC
jgi:hypothetical protein